MPSTTAQLLGFVVVFAFLASATSLSSDEEVVIGQIYDSFPTLSALPHSALMASKEFRGLPWTRNFSSLCINGSGWSFYGVHCDANGNIDGLQLYVPKTSHWD